MFHHESAMSFLNGVLNSVRFKVNLGHQEHCILGTSKSISVASTSHAEPEIY